MIILLGTLALACFVSMVVALLVVIKLAAELRDEKRARRTPCVNGEASRGEDQ